MCYSRDEEAFLKKELDKANERIEIKLENKS